MNGVYSFKRVKIAMTNTQESKSKKNKQSFLSVDIGIPKVPVRKTNAKKTQQSESLSDWEHAS